MAKNNLTAARLHEVLIVLRERSTEGVQKAPIARSLGLKSAHMDWILKRNQIAWAKPPVPTNDEKERRAARKAYRDQKANARCRCIEWGITFDEWWAIWSNSEKWEFRGRRKGEFVMSRRGDVGPYAVGNVVVKSNRDNLMEARAHSKKRSRKNGGVYFTLPGYSRPWCAKWNRKHIGYFETEEEARAARTRFIEEEAVAKAAESNGYN